MPSSALVESAIGCVAWSTRVDIIVDFLCGSLTPNDDGQVLVERIRLAPQVADGLLRNLENAMSQHMKLEDLPVVGTDEGEGQ